jgi:H+/Cl- antiporter ClcA
MLDFSINLFDSYALLLAAMAAVALGAMVGKRLTDTEHRERVERAKKAPVVVAGPMTGEHQAQQGGQQVNVNLGPERPKDGAE